MKKPHQVLRIAHIYLAQYYLSSLENCMSEFRILI